MNCSDSLQNLFAILQSHFTLVVESDRQVINRYQRRFDFFLQQRTNLFVENVRCQRTSHIVVLDVGLRGVRMSCNDAVLLYPQSIDIILKAEPRREKRRQTEPVIVTGNSAIDSPILVSDNWPEVFQHVNLIYLVQIFLPLLFVVQIHFYVVECVDVVGTGSKTLCDFNHCIFWDWSILE